MEFNQIRSRKQSFGAKMGRKPEYMDKDLEQVVRKLNKTNKQKKSSDEVRKEEIG